MSIIAIKERLSGFAKKNTENTRGGHRCQNEGGHARRAHSDRGYREGLRSGLGPLCRRRPPLLRNRARKDGGVFLFRLPLSHGHLLGHDDASAERRRSPRLVRPGLPHLHAHLLVRGGLRDHYQDWRPHGRPLRDEAAEGGCRSAGDSGAVLSDAQGGVFCRSGRDEGEGARPFA